VIKGQAGQSVGAQMIDASTGAAFTGTVTIYITIDGGTQAIGTVNSGVCVHEGNGFHSYAPTAAETNGALVACTFIGIGAIPATVQYPTMTAPQAAALAGVPVAGPIITIRDVCTAALQRLGVYGAGDRIPAEDLALAVSQLNVLKDSWRTQRLFTYALVRTTFTITANDGVYTVGPGGDLNIARPVFLQRIRLINTAVSPTQEFSIRLLTDVEYAGWPQKSLTSPWPTAVYYNPTSPLGTITFVPVPTSTTLQLVIYTPNDSPSVADSDVLDVPAGYQLFYQEALAVHLAPVFGKPASQDLKDSARDAKADIKRANLRLTDLIVRTPFGPSGFYDINSDQVH
jgi:hypothetical protein